MVVFILSITNEYSDTFVVSSVKNVIQSEMSKIVIEKPDCQSTALVKMDFSATTKEIDVQTMGCRIDMSQVAETVETEMCGAKTPTGGQHLVCNGIDYWINEVYNG